MGPASLYMQIVKNAIKICGQYGLNMTLVHQIQQMTITWAGGNIWVDETQKKVSSVLTRLK